MGPTLEIVPEEAVREPSAVLIDVEIADQFTNRIAVHVPGLGGWTNQRARQPWQRPCPSGRVIVGRCASSAPLSAINAAARWREVYREDLSRSSGAAAPSLTTSTTRTYAARPLIISGMQNESSGEQPECSNRGGREGGSVVFHVGGTDGQACRSACSLRIANREFTTAVSAQPLPSSLPIGVT